MVARYVFDVAGIAAPSYLDIGAHHPFELSNTAAFYKAGSRGVNVEPEIVYHRLLERYRPHDVNLHAGVAEAAGSMPFYVLSAPTLSTFVRSEAEDAQERGFELVDQIEVPVLTVTEIIERHFEDGPNFLSLDTEGMDAAILKSLDFARHAPMVACVENAPHSGDDSAISGTLRDLGYRSYAHTHINSIFLRDDLWSKVTSPG